MTSPMLDDLRRMYHGAWWALMLRGLLALAVGVVILLRPLDSVAGFALVIAFWSFFAGFVEILYAIELSRVLRHWWLMLIAGLVGVGFGVAAMVYYPGLSLTFAVLLVAWWLMVTGVIGIYAAFRARGLGVQWGWTALWGVLSVAASVFALAAPPVTLAAIMGLIATFGLISGVVLVIAALRLRSVTTV